jgi:cytochrome oxidase Cu insertion factor (SCO1/SenC/PrrC family)
MKRPSRWLLAALFAGITFVGCQAPPTDDKFGAVENFQLTERNGHPVKRDDLTGKVWIAAFFFSRCTGPCTQISGAMARLQKELAQYPNVLLVSFSVDPEHDTSAVLRRYADKFGADPARWLFLTGDQATIYRLSHDCFKMAVQQNQGTERTPGNEVMHGTRLVLVDKQGQVRGWYDPTDEEKLAELRKKVAYLVREKP